MKTKRGSKFSLVLGIGGVALCFFKPFMSAMDSFLSGNSIPFTAFLVLAGCSLSVVAGVKYALEYLNPEL